MTQQAEGRRILVVEDEMLVAMLLQDMLTALGHAVVGPAATIDAALAAIEREPMDAALLDINLGGREVYPVAEALTVRAVPFAFVTGYDDGGVAPAWRGWLRLEKPFLQTDLERILERLFNAA